MGSRGPAPRLTVATLEAAEHAHDRVLAALRSFRDAMDDKHVSIDEQQSCWRELSKAVTASGHVVTMAERADIAQLAAVSMLSGAINQHTAGRMASVGLDYTEPLDAA
jgi:hypothetical protein